MRPSGPRLARCQDPSGRRQSAWRKKVGIDPGFTKCRSYRSDPSCLSQPATSIFWTRFSCAIFAGLDLTQKNARRSGCAYRTCCLKAPHWRQLASRSKAKLEFCLTLSQLEGKCLRCSRCAALCSLTMCEAFIQARGRRAAQPVVNAWLGGLGEQLGWCNQKRSIFPDSALLRVIFREHRDSDKAPPLFSQTNGSPGMRWQSPTPEACRG